MIDGQIFKAEPLPAILTSVLIPSKNVAARQFGFQLWKLVIGKESHHWGTGSSSRGVLTHGTDPLDFTPNISDVAPVGEVVGPHPLLFHRDHFGQLLAQQAERPSGRDNTNGGIEPIEQQDRLIKSRPIVRVEAGSKIGVLSDMSTIPQELGKSGQDRYEESVCIGWNLRPRGVLFIHRRFATMGLEATMPVDNILTTQVQAVINWARRSAVWPMPFATACCGIELMATAMSRYDLSRFGAEVFRFSPRQADLMIVAGRISTKMLPVMHRITTKCVNPNG